MRETKVTIIITYSVLGSSQCVDIGSATDVSEAHLASVFRVKVSRVSGSLDTWKNKPTGGEVGLTSGPSQQGQRTGNVNIAFTGPRICTLYEAPS
jgi:hypothetical protein